MKPLWDDAPEWARWLAVNKRGNWYWFEFKPHADMMFNVFTPSRKRRSSRYQFAGKNLPTYQENEGWMHTRERRNDGIRKV